MGKPSRVKGYKYENDVRKWHVEMGVHAERVPLSGGARYQSGGHDLDVYAFGRDVAPLCCEAKIRAALPGWLRGWLGDNDVLFMRDNGGETIVALPARTWVRLLRLTNKPPAGFNPHEKIEDLGAHFAECHKLKIPTP